METRWSSSMYCRIKNSEISNPNKFVIEENTTGERARRIALYSISVHAHYGIAVTSRRVILYRVMCVYYMVIYIVAR